MIEANELTWAIGVGTSSVSPESAHVATQDAMAELLRDATQAALAIAQQWLEKFAAGRPVQILGTTVSPYVNAGGRWASVIATIHFRCGTIVKP